MPINKHPRGDRGVFEPTLRPNLFNPSTFDEVIIRQGQYVRWIKSRPCPVRTEASTHDLKCQICHGRGDIYEIQKTVWVYEEQSPHGSKSVACSEDTIIPWKEPIVEVGKIIRYLSPEQGGITEYRVKSFTKNSIIIDLMNPDDKFPESWEVIFVDYSIDLREITEQEFISDGKTIIYTLDLDLADKARLLTNSLNIKPFISEIISVLDENNDPIPYTSSFNQNVYLENPVLSGKTIKIKAYYQEPILMVLEPLDIEKSREYHFDSYEVGDMMAIMSPTWDVGEGDLITCLANRNRREELMTRSDLDFDVLPYYDIHKIDEIIYDDKGNKYFNNIDFYLFDYNKIRWIGNQPTFETVYSVSFMELMTYRAISSKARLNSNENKRLPKHCHLRKLDRLQRGTLQTGVKKVESPVGDWTTKYGGI
jgi:hypothetical protein